MKAKVDPDLCVGTGSCVSLCPNVFQLGDDGIATVKVNEVAPADQAACREAAEQCPTDAISIEG